MQKLTKKQTLKRKTITVAGLIHLALTGKPIGIKEVLKNFPETSYYKSGTSGEQRVGLSLKGIRKLIKKYPAITPEQIMEYFNITPITGD